MLSASIFGIGILHTQETEYVIDEIDRMIRRRKRRKKTEIRV